MTRCDSAQPALKASRRVLLINPRITGRRNARFPLSLLTLAAKLADSHSTRLIDGNVENCVAATLSALDEEPFDAVGITVMGGPQVATAIEVSKAIKERQPEVPIVWGGYFPTLYPRAAINAPYVDYLVRGQGEETFGELLGSLTAASANRNVINGLTYKNGSEIIHNVDRRFADRRSPDQLPYELLGDARKYLVRTFLGQRTAAYQAALGCRFRCTFCGVASMYRGAVALPPAERLERDLTFIKNRIGADSIQFFDHNFFDREVDMISLLEVLARMELPWWCYARADALLNLSSESWAMVRKSRLRMAYIGAESASDALLKSIRKGTKANQTLAVADLCRRNGVIPELSFMVAPPQDTEAETERTFDFIREIKRVNPLAEIIVYIYTPLPAASLPADALRGRDAEILVDLQGNPLRFPQTPEEWTEKRWVDYSCHADAPWITPRLRERIRNFVTVLGCRFPTVQDIRSPSWAKTTLRTLAAWRYRFRMYDRPWELNLSRRVIRLRDPKVTSI